MSLEKVKQVKIDRGFKVADLIIYAVILLLAAALFTAVFLTRNPNPLRGVKISVDGEAVFTYDFESDKYVADESRAKVTEQDGKMYITVTANGGYNVFEIFNADRKVRVTEADCPSKTCTYMAVNDNNGVIHCASHRVKCEPFGYDPDGGNIPFG